ncbi:MAG: AtpZ/AtpI family protein [Rhodospirillaceae bacterium]|nr:MAG: AtpZ/AtpI family protein [Rhodospirillaceae bacterium]
MTDIQPPASGAPSKPALSREDLAARLAAAQEREAANTQAQERRRGQATGVNLGMRIGIELVASVLVGGGLGWFADEKLHTKPIFLLALLSLGFTAGVMNVIRIAKGLDQSGGLGRDGTRTKNDVAAPPVPADDDDD